jgi:fido (protein-threonine AMPylation protein)
LLDLVTKKREISESLIRELHIQLCREQGTYEVWTPAGRQQQELKCGEYKTHPNHVIQADGSIHAYAPVDLVSSEMHRLCEELRSERFSKAHPVLQAAYAHYALVAIHPFPDGNGRVARALASVFYCRAQRIPLLILFEHKDAYFDALAKADGGEFQSFIDFVYDRGLDAFRLVQVAMHTASCPSLDEARSNLRALYKTKSGFTQPEVDKAAVALFDGFQLELVRRANALSEPNVLAIECTPRSVTDGPKTSSRRFTAAIGPRACQVLFRSFEPAKAEITDVFQLEVPLNHCHGDTLIVRNVRTGSEFAAGIDEVQPQATPGLAMRIQMHIEGCFGRSLTDLIEAARPIGGHAVKTE